MVLARLKKLFHFPNASRTNSIGSSSKLSTDEMNAGRLMGGATRANKALMDEWRALCNAQGVKPTQRLLGVAAYDLEQATVAKYKSEPEKPVEAPPDKVDSLSILANMIEKLIVDKVNVAKVYHDNTMKEMQKQQQIEERRLSIARSAAQSFMIETPDAKNHYTAGNTARR